MYRMYVDETGSEETHNCHEPENQYLSLTGVIMSASTVRCVANPELTRIKHTHFRCDADFPFVFHRKELIECKRRYGVLREPERKASFNEDILSLYERLSYIVVSVVIDKYELVNKHIGPERHPYHYAIEVLLERFCFFLRDSQATGTMIAESRDRAKNRLLKKSFSDLFTNGTDHLSRNFVQKWIRASHLPCVPKDRNISGLQIADLIAHPSAKYIRSLYRDEAPPTGFGGQLVDILIRDKYYRRPDGTIEGYGIKILPI